MYLDGKFNFGLPTILNSNTATVSANYYDAGAARIEFGNSVLPLWLWFRATITADASPTIQVEFIASSATNLAAATQEVLASSGIINIKDDGSGALASGDTVERAVPIQAQRIARRYYGLVVTLGGTNPDLAAGQDAEVVNTPQTNMPGARAAVPA